MLRTLPALESQMSVNSQLKHVGMPSNMVTNCVCYILFCCIHVSFVANKHKKTMKMAFVTKANKVTNTNTEMPNSIVCNNDELWP